MSKPKRGVFSPWFCFTYPLLWTAAAVVARPQWLPSPNNYTGNFVWTPAFSMDANRSATSLLPQSALLYQLYVELFGTNCTKLRVSTVCSVAILTIYARLVGKITRFDHFCRSLENNSSARCFRDDQRPKELRNSNTRPLIRTISVSLPPKLSRVVNFTEFCFLIGVVCVCFCNKVWRTFIPPRLLARGPLVAGHSLNPVEFPPCCVAFLVTTTAKLLARRCGFITLPHRNLASCKMYILLGLTLHRTTRHSSNNNNLRFRSHPHFCFVRVGRCPITKLDVDTC